MSIKKEEPTRILHITEMLSAAGIESFIMNMYRHIDRSKVQFDFLVLRNQKEFYDDEIKKLGGKKYFVESTKKNTWARILDESKQIENFLKKNSYQIVHIHYTTPLRAPYLLAAKRAGVKTRIYHAHSAAVSGKSNLKLLVYSYYRKKITKWATDYFACSKAAAEWIFEENLVKNGIVKVIYNGIDIDRFAFNEKTRISTRKQLGLKNEYVIIHTGRFLEQKNHKFIIKVFDELKKKYNNVRLLLLGTGELVEEIKSMVLELGLQQDVIFLGVKADVENYLCAADCYLMPSLYEGLPVAAVEAECSGLPCVFSENITREIELQENVKFLSLNDSEEEWCKQILKFKDLPRTDGKKAIKKNGYSIEAGAKNLQKFYENRIYEIKQ